MKSGKKKSPSKRTAKKTVRTSKVRRASGVSLNAGGYSGDSKAKRASGAAQATNTSDPQVFFRPERYNYVRGPKKTNSACVFCLGASEQPSSTNLFLYRDDLAQVVMNKFPYNSGHLLVLPRRHEGDLTKLSNEEMLRIARLIQFAVTSIRKEYNPQAFNIGLNLGAASGAGLPDHLHYHIVPRWNGDTNFFPLIAKTKVVVETLEQTYARLAPHFKDFKIEN